jgi:hypothetical protein
MNIHTNWVRNSVFKSTVTDMATLRNFEVMFGIFNVGKIFTNAIRSSQNEITTFTTTTATAATAITTTTTTTTTTTNVKFRSYDHPRTSPTR